MESCQSAFIVFFLHQEPSGKQIKIFIVWVLYAPDENSKAMPYFTLVAQIT
jgi:hypothetical protein